MFFWVFGTQGHSLPITVATEHHILHILHPHPPPHKFQSSGRASWTLPPSPGVSGATPWLSPSAWGVPHRSPTTGPRRWTTVSPFELVTDVWKWGKPPIYSNIHGENDVSPLDVVFFLHSKPKWTLKDQRLHILRARALEKLIARKSCRLFQQWEGKVPGVVAGIFLGSLVIASPAHRKYDLKLSHHSKEAWQQRIVQATNESRKIPLVIRMVAADRLILQINTTYLYIYTV